MAMKKLLIFVSMFLVLSAGIALADSNLDVVMSTTALSGVHGSTISGSFLINNTNVSDSITNISCSISISGWNHSCAPSTTLSSNGTVTTSFTVDIPRYTPPATAAGTITVGGNLTSSGTSVGDTQAFTVLVAASPSYSISWTTPPKDMYQEQNQTVAFNITNNGNVALTTAAILHQSRTNDTLYNKSLGSILSQGSVTGTAFVNSTDDSSVGPYSLIMTVTGTYNATSNVTTTSTQNYDLLYPYCDDILTTNLTTTPIKIDQIKNENDIEDKDFKPLEEIEIDIKIENKDDDDRITAIAEAVLIFEDGEADDTDVEEKIKIKDDDLETLTLTIKVPADIKEGIHYLYLKVYNDDDSDNCQQRVIRLEIKKSSRETIPSDVEFDSTIACGETLSFSGKVVNIGEKDEEKVKVQLKAFGQIFEEIYNDLDEGDKSSLFDFNIPIPPNTIGSTKMVFNIFSDYDDDDKVFDESETFSFSTTVTCDIADVSFTTETSVALVDKESEVRILVKNPGATTESYALSATASWAEVKSIVPSTLTLSAGSEQYVTVRIQPNKDTEIGTYNLAFSSTHDGKTEVLNVPVSVQKSSKSTGVFSRLAFAYKNNTAWSVVNTVLVVAIAAVLALIFTGRNKPNFGKVLNKLKKTHK